MSEPLVRFPTQAEVPESARVDAERWARRYLVGGEVRAWAGPSADVLSPVCHPDAGGALRPAVVGQLAQLDGPAALEALAAAKGAWASGAGPWATARVARRIGALEDFASRMGEAREDVVRLLMWEIAKTRRDAESEFDRTVVYVRDTVEALKELDRSSSRFVLEQGFLGMVRRSPLGVVLCMGPFNYPLNETYTTLIPALVMGNSVVSKLPKLGALCHLPLLEALAACFPPGVVNVIAGDGPETVGPIMRSGDVDVLAFIGTSRVVNVLKKQHPRPNRLRSITGLEAKNPAVVLPCADLDVAVRECASGALSFNGQRCTGIKLVFVHESLAAAFVERFAAAVDAMKAGMPWEPGVTLTPLPEPGKPAYLRALVDDALAHGASLVGGGGGALATFFRPAVVYPVSPSAKLWETEQFGPVVPIAVYRDEAEVSAFMQASAYGQQVALFGRDPRRVAALVDALANQVARINLNSQCRRGPDTFPFTGRKDSAEGTLSVSDALRAFSIRTVVAASTSDENKELVSEIASRRLSTFLSTDFLF
jgi:glyceraldehyde-3-phosphate dehydrogenase (NADP+)